MELSRTTIEIESCRAYRVCRECEREIRPRDRHVVIRRDGFRFPFHFDCASTFAERLYDADCEER